LPAKVEQVIVKAMAKEPKERYPSIAKMNEAFQKTMQEVYDPESGRLKPGAKSPPPTADDFIVPPDDDGGGFFARIGRRFPMPAMVLFMLLLLVGGLWAASRIVENMSPGDDPGNVAAIPTSDAQATIDALSTAVAIRSGLDDLSGEQIETAVAGTMQALETAAFGSVNETLAAAGENTPTDTPVPLTATSTRTPTLTPTSIFSPTITLTRTITRTPTITLTRTITPTLTLTTTLTPAPTTTPTITPTLTITRTPTTDPCDGIDVNGPDVYGGVFVKWTITNSTGSSITLTNTWLSWPKSPNDILVNVYLPGGAILPVFDESSPTTVTDHAVIGTSGGNLKFEFMLEAASSGYDLELTFDTGCIMD
jgi:hypothetical protein